MRECRKPERLEPAHEKRQAGLTNLVFPFHGKFHHQLLGVGANEDKWRSRLLADLGILKRERGNNELCSATWLPRTESRAALKGFSSPVIDRQHTGEAKLTGTFIRKVTSI